MEIVESSLDSVGKGSPDSIDDIVDIVSQTHFGNHDEDYLYLYFHDGCNLWHKKPKWKWKNNLKEKDNKIEFICDDGKKPTMF